MREGEGGGRGRELTIISASFLPFRLFTTEALEELVRFHKQKSADFRSILINFIQLQMHMHRKVTQPIT